jgi:hypothetical protein
MSVLDRFGRLPARSGAFPPPPVWADTLAAWAGPRRVERLALIWPFDPMSGVIGGIVPLAEGPRLATLAGGYAVVAAVAGHPPYTHVVSAGRQDYLASFAPPPPAVAAAERAAAIGARFDRAAEEGWESDGGAHIRPSDRVARVTSADRRRRSGPS